MTAQPPRPLESIEELVEVVELRDLTTFEIVARRRAEPLPAGSQEFQLQFAPKLNHNFISARFRLQFETPEATYLADMAAQYSTSEPVIFSADVFVDFIERVAFMATFPYLRESIYSSAARLGTNRPTLGIMRSGAFSLELADEDLANLLSTAWDDSLHLAWEGSEEDESP